MAMSVAEAVVEAIEKSTVDLINEPPHYVAGRKYEPWDVIADWQLDYFLGNIVKYISRCGRKAGTTKLDDLYKAKAYLEHAIELEERQGG